MKITDMLLMSLESLWKRKVRTFLTILGVLIGTISVVVMISIGIGMRTSIMQELENYGSLTQIRVEANVYGDQTEKIKYLDNAIVDEIGHFDNVESVIPVLSVNVDYKVGIYEGYAEIMGVPKGSFDKLGIKLGEGQFPENEKEMELYYGNALRAQLYNVKTHKYLYWEENIVPDVDFKRDVAYFMFEDTSSNSSTADGSPQQQKPKKKHTFKYSGTMPGDIEDYSQFSHKIITNIDAFETTLKRIYKKNPIPGQPVRKNGKPYSEMYYSYLMVNVDAMENVTAVQDKIKDMGYNAYADAEWISSQMSTLNIIQAALGGIGAVALFVAAIGIINTMMMSIYERTKEIGIMKVIGCSLPNLQFLFLIEAGMIGFIGGTVGVGISYAISHVVNMLISQSDMGYETISIIPLWLSVLAIIFAIIIGMIAGFIPSLRAMKISPLEAMRT